MQPLLSIPPTLLLIYRAHTNRSLTPLGILTATLTALIHALHPWPAPFFMLITFYLLGTTATRIKHDVKATLTHSSSSSSPSSSSPPSTTSSPGSSSRVSHPTPRTAAQVLANSLPATVCVLLHLRFLARQQPSSLLAGAAAAAATGANCWRKAADPLPLGIIATYAAAAADTLGSELGILSSAPPRLIVAPWRRVPRGTNGGVSGAGLVAGAVGAGVVVGVAVGLVPFCEGGEYAAEEGWGAWDRVVLVLWGIGWGVLGSLVDSVLGAVVQRSVVDVRDGKIVEGEGGKSVPVRGEGKGMSSKGSMEGESGRDGSRRVESGWDVLDNNGVNFAMACTMSVGAVVGGAWLWDVPLSSFI